MGWYYRIAGTTQGPIDRDHLVALFQKGTLTPQVEVSEGGSHWSMAPQVPGLMADVLANAVEAPAPPKADPGSRFAAAPNANTAPASSRPGMSTKLPGPGAAAPTQSVAPPAALPVVEDSTGEGSAPEAGAVSGVSPDAAPAAESESEPEVERPSGPVGHIVLDPNSRRHLASRQSGTGFIKTAACGLLGLAAMVAIGLFAANKVFGIDVRPAMIDRSVSKFMIENPEIVAHLDVETIIKSKALRRAGLDSHPKLPYISDAEDVIFVSDSLDPTAPRFLAIIHLKRDYRTEFIANLFRNGSTSTVGEFQMHTDSRGLGGLAMAACLPEPRTLLVGSPYILRSVLERNDYPKLSPRESELVAAITGGGNSASIGMFFDSVEGMISTAKADIDDQLGQLGEKNPNMADQLASGPLKMIGDVDYAVRNIKFMTIEVDMSDGDGRIEARTRAECINPWKAKKVVTILKDLMASAPSAAAQLNSFTSTLPVATGSTIEGTASFDPREFGDAFSAGLAKQGF